MELPPSAKEAALHGRVAVQTAPIATVHVEDGRAPRGIVRRLVGKLHNKGTELKELEVPCPHVVESVVVVDRGL